MKDENTLIQALYGEGDLPENGSQAEYERLTALKEQLDERPAQRPDPDVVERVVETAGQAASSSQGRQSRSDRPGRSRRSHVLRRAGVALASLLVAVAVGWWTWPDRAGDRSEEIAQNEVMSSSPETNAPVTTAPDAAETKQAPAESDAADAPDDERASDPADAAASVPAEPEQQSAANAPEPARADAPSDTRKEVAPEERASETTHGALPDWDLASTTSQMHRRILRLERQVEPQSWGPPPEQLYRP